MRSSAVTGDRAAVLVLQLEHARRAMAGEVQHVVGVVLDRLADLIWVADLEDAHLDVLVTLRRLDRVEDRLQLALLVEHRRPRLLLVRRADRDKDLERPGQRRHFRAPRARADGAA